MTNQNPASTNTQSIKLSQEILSKVNAHADRTVDRLFADIDELLSGDLTDDIHSSSQPQQRRLYSAEPSRSTQTPPPQLIETQTPPPQYRQERQAPPEFTPPQPSVEPPVVQPEKAKRQKRNSPSLIKVLLSIGVASIAISSILLWLINERKIQLPKDLDTSWLPFQSSSKISTDDAKFAEYMRKSISKIETANTQPTVSANPTTPVDSTAIAPASPGIVTTTPTDPAVTATPIALIKTLTGDKPGAIFEINSQTQTIYAGGKIGTSEWSLLTVAKGEVIIKKAGGVIRSIYVGQKF